LRNSSFISLTIVSVETVDAKEFPITMFSDTFYFDEKLVTAKVINMYIREYKSAKEHVSPTQEETQNINENEVETEQELDIDEKDPERHQLLPSRNV